jgi:hypothetical protein
MTETVDPKPEFRSLDEASVVSALRDLDPGNPIPIEVARLIHGYTTNFHAHVQRMGCIPPEILHIEPRWPIEAVAMRLTTEIFRETLPGHGARETT